MTALPERCFCAVPLRVDDGLVLCDHGHGYALASAMPAAVFATLAEDQG